MNSSEIHVFHHLVVLIRCAEYLEICLLAHVSQTILELHLHVVRNVLLTQTVLHILLVSTINVKILVLDRVVSVQSVLSSAIQLAVLVHLE